jgi:hypothetical protein
MEITRYQLKVLRVWLRYHAAGYSVGQSFRTGWKPLSLLVAMSALAYTFVVPASAAVGWGLVGLCLGALLRDLGYY